MLCTNSWLLFLDNELANRIFTMKHVWRYKKKKTCVLFFRWNLTRSVWVAVKPDSVRLLLFAPEGLGGSGWRLRNTHSSSVEIAVQSVESTWWELTKLFFVACAWKVLFWQNFIQWTQFLFVLVVVLQWRHQKFCGYDRHNKVKSRYAESIAFGHGLEIFSFLLHMS